MRVANRKNVKLLVEERRRRILELLDKEERATVEELSDRFDVSSVTIRGDLDTLADAGAIVRSQSGPQSGSGLTNGIKVRLHNRLPASYQPVASLNTWLRPTPRYPQLRYGALRRTNAKSAASGLPLVRLDAPVLFP